MKEIVSKTNTEIKLLKKLSQKKYRDRLSLFKVENLKIIIDGLDDGAMPEKIFVTKKMKDKIKLKDSYLISDSLNKYISNLETPSGVCAVYRKKDSKISKTGPYIYLNGINNPGNLGAIIRSGVLFGFNNFIFDEYTVDIYNSKTINASKNAIFKINFTIDDNLKILKKLKKKNKIIATNVNEGKAIDDLRASKDFCLILGSESHGISDKVLKLVDIFTHIKTNNSLESLSVSNAASIIFHNYFNKNS